MKGVQQTNVFSLVVIAEKLQVGGALSVQGKRKRKQNNLCSPHILFQVPTCFQPVTPPKKKKMHLSKSAGTLTEVIKLRSVLPNPGWFSPKECLTVWPQSPPPGQAFCSSLPAGSLPLVSTLVDSLMLCSIGEHWNSFFYIHWLGSHLEIPSVLLASPLEA